MGNKSWIKNVSEDYLRQHMENFRLCDILRNRKLSEQFIRQFADEIDWNILEQETIFSKDFIREFQDKLSLFNVLNKRNLSEDFINEIINTSIDDHQRKYIIWNLCICYQMSQDFLQKYIEDIDWGDVSKYQNMSEDFMRKYADKIYWLEVKKRNIQIPKDLQKFVQQQSFYESILELG